ncbi:MAG: DNA polymerase III subunit alpha, partial [Kiritimatiellia bacterium]|nr:DNA polymerase III subunit alpha [Kiritimatiellia bacterium]
MTGVRSFAHLHVHSAHSLLDGLCRIPDLAETVHSLGMTAAALTDHAVLHGAFDFYDAARRIGIRPILGCEIPLRLDGADAFPVVLLATNFAGFENLQRLITLAHQNVGTPALDAEGLAAHRAHLLGLTGAWPFSRIAGLCAEDRIREAVTLTGAFSDILEAGSCFMELQNHGFDGQLMANVGLRQVGRRLGLPTLAAHTVNYLQPGDAEAHALVQCIRTGQFWKDRDRVPFPTRQMHLRSPEEMAAAFPDDGPALERTLDVAARCACEIPTHRPFSFPSIPPPVSFQPPNSEFRTETAYLRQLALEGLARRAQSAALPAEWIARLDAELRSLEQVGAVRLLRGLGDLASAAREQGIPLGPGRGALPSSLIAYALGVTGVDPLKAGLHFERWLNPSLSTSPELGLEIAPDDRGKLVAHLRSRYGDECVAHLLTFPGIGPRQALRDAARVFEVDTPKADALIRQIPESSFASDSLRRIPVPGDPLLAAAVRAASRIEGLPRKPGTHPTGLVLSGGPVADRAPVARDGAGVLHVQLDQHGLNRAGLLKVDLLGSRVLQAIAATLQDGNPVDPDSLPLEDPAVYERLADPEPADPHPIDSPELRNLILRIRPRQLGDLALALALNRPDPPVAADEWIHRRTEPGTARADDPLLDPILSETCGLFIYEEQVISALRERAGQGTEAADRFLRLAQDQPAAARKYRQTIMDGLRRTTRIREPRAARLFDRLLAAAPRVCGKAPVYSAALQLYRTCWLKIRLPREFLAARLAAEPGQERRLAALLEEARRLKVKLFSPDIHSSGVRFQPVPGGILFGLCAIRHIGEDTARALVSERERNGPFLSLTELCRRMDPLLLTHRVLDALIRCGALDSVGEARSNMAAEQREFQSGAAALR